MFKNFAHDRKLSRLDSLSGSVNKWAAITNYTTVVNRCKSFINLIIYEISGLMFRNTFCHDFYLFYFFKLKLFIKVMRSVSCNLSQWCKEIWGSRHDYKQYEICNIKIFYISPTYFVLFMVNLE